MASSDWNFTTYLVSLSQTREGESNVVQQSPARFVHQEEKETDRVFTVLKPAFETNIDCCEGQQKDARPLLRFLTVSSEEFPELLITDQMGAKSGNDTREDVVEQPLISWDLNRLTMFGSEAIVGDVIDEPGCLASKGRENWHHGGMACSACDPNESIITAENSNYHSNNENVTDDVTDEFKFPKCIEDRFREMMLRSCMNCKNCGSHMVHTSRNESHRMVHPHIPCKDAQLRREEAERQCEQEARADGMIKDGTKNGRETIEDEESCRDQKPRVTHDSCDIIQKPYSALKTDGIRELATNVEENIDELLTLINPDVDVMGKTFHNIPSTQPIYSDNEARDETCGEENRVRRPMNAFMLWARKYR